MPVSRILPTLVIALAVASCRPSAPVAEEAVAGKPASEPPAVAAHEYLPTPFTAAEIRDEWIEGLMLVLRYRYPDREERQRWTVVAADADGAEIEYQPLDAAGAPTGEADRARSSWTDLRDHALFPAARARRERAERDTDLGSLEGWLYTVEDPAAGTVTELFFAEALAGAPVWMQTRQGEAVMMELTQLERRRPADPETAPDPG